MHESGIVGSYIVNWHYLTRLYRIRKGLRKEISELARIQIKFRSDMKNMIIKAWSFVDGGKQRVCNPHRQQNQVNWLFSCSLYLLKDIAMYQKFYVVLKKPAKKPTVTHRSWTKGWRRIHEIKQNRFFYGMFYKWLSAIFYPDTSKFGFWVDGWVLVIKSKHFEDFPKISYFPKMLSLKSFGNLWRNSDIYFLVIIILFLLTCGDEKLC